MFLQNLKFVALSVPQIIGGTPKIWTVPGYDERLSHLANGNVADSLETSQKSSSRTSS